MQDRIELRLGSLLEPIDEQIDYLLSNPPYIANEVVLSQIFLMNLKMLFLAEQLEMK